MFQRYKLMIPGPTQSPDYILREMGEPVLPHYESEWSEIYWQIQDDLKKVFGTEEMVIPINGSGTLACEMPMAGVIKEGTKVLCLDNSFFSKSMGTAAEGFGGDVTFLGLEKFKPVPPDTLADALKNSHYELVVIAHHDTASGYLEPLETVGNICRNHNVLLLADCVSSIGALPFKMDEWGVDFACASVQKGLDCPAGIGLVAASKQGWEKLEKAAPANRGRYMNLLKWRESMLERKTGHPNLISIATNNMMALKASLKVILEEGLENRLNRMIRYGTMIRRGIRNMGLDTVVADEYAPLVTKVRFPERIDRDEARDFVRYNYGILLGVEFRIAHFGHGINEDSITLVLTALEDFLRTKGMEIPYGKFLEGLEEFRGNYGR